MKRYLVFSGDRYDGPLGWDGFDMSTDDLKEAETFARQSLNHGSMYRFTQVVDTETLDAVLDLVT